MTRAAPTRRPVLAACALAVCTAGCQTSGAPRATDDPAGRGVTISGEELEATQANSAWEALRIRVAFAVFVTDADGQPSGIYARGRSSVQRQESMLVYVDRAPLPDLRMLLAMPISRVERVVVLRGPDATTFFGTNAGDGVIQIFTRTR